MLNDRALGGTGLLAIFCDLADSDKPGFRPWLSEDMFPARIDIGFKACGSFDKIQGDGPEFVTMYEMPSLGHLYGEPYQALRRIRNPRDAAYHKKFQNPERYTLNWAGPELNFGGDGFSSYVAIDRFDLPKNATQEFNISFVCDYLPALERVPGVLRVRRYLSMEGTPAHFVLHEFSDIDVLENVNEIQVRRKFRDATFGLYQRMIEAT
jgi:hypothetical protein